MCDERVTICVENQFMSLFIGKFIGDPKSISPVDQQTAWTKFYCFVLRLFILPFQGFPKTIGLPISIMKCFWT